jgi:hypothetical protein
MAATAVQFSDTDTAFLVEALYHLTSPLTVRGTDHYAVTHFF